MEQDNEKVQISDDDKDLEDTQSSQSLGTKLEATIPGIKEIRERNNKDVLEAASDEGNNQRYSGRLAAKNPDDLPVLDRAKLLTKSKNLDKAAEGEGGLKIGTAVLRKTSGTGRVMCFLQEGDGNRGLEG